ncbi:MAG: acetyl-CoA C-acetyltransferase [Oscillospiraceae bacterium]|nr:acetyl-CoA C-acetyltransferase [Oscillospiraceae bacterium]
MSKEIVLAGYARTPIGKYGGTLLDVPVWKLAGHVIREAVKRAGIPGDQVDEVLAGCVLPTGDGQNVARQAVIDAGLPITVSATTINNVCCSGLKVINMAASEIKAGNAEVIVVAGMESMSRIPYALDKARFGYRMGDGQLYDLMFRDGLTDPFHHYHMGITAENLVEKFGITREQQDEFALGSQLKCEAARKAGKFAEEIVPIEIKTRKGTILFEHDEYPVDGMTIEALAKQRPAFKKEGGTVTAGNASGINDGAAAMVVMSAEAAERLGVTPLARFIGGTTAGVEPAIMGIGPVPATEKLFKQTGLTIEDMDVIEANEAFAAQTLAVGLGLKWDESKVNPNGGAIALGHPVGMTGCRILGALILELRRRGGGKGLATLCGGGGMGVSAIVETL